MELGHLTDRPCPRCTKPLRVDDQFYNCPDRVHCQFSTLRDLLAVIPGAV